MKSPEERKRVQDASRSPCGERGLKCEAAKMTMLRMPVAPRAGSVG